jgi:hypothetical protein
MQTSRIAANTGPAMNTVSEPYDLRSSGILRSAVWQFLTDASGQPIIPILKSQENLLFFT